MRELLIQIASWLISYYVIWGHSSYSTKSSFKKNTSIFSAASFLLISFFLNQGNGFLQVTLLTTIMLILLSAMQKYLKFSFIREAMLQLLIVSMPACTHNGLLDTLMEYVKNFEITEVSLIYIISYAICLAPANIIIKLILNRIIGENLNSQNNAHLKNESTERAGRTIGNIERIITLSLIYAGQFEAISLLIAAKSILRINESKISEYVLIGTLSSFGWAIITGLLAKEICNLF